MDTTTVCNGLYKWLLNPFGLLNSSMDVDSDTQSFTTLDPLKEISESIENRELEDDVVFVTVGLDEIDSDEETLDGDEQVNVEIESDGNSASERANFEETNEIVNDDDENTLDALDTDIVTDNFDDLGRHFKIESLSNGEKYFSSEANNSSAGEHAIYSESQFTNEVKHESETDVAYDETPQEIQAEAVYEAPDSVKTEQVLLLLPPPPSTVSSKKKVQYGTLMSDGSICLESGQILSPEKPRERLKEEEWTLTLKRDSPYICTVCGKSFTRKFSLQAHHSVHFENSPYVCTICGKNFIQLCHLKDHVRSHKGEKPHQCFTCDKQFTRISDLKRHKLLHLGRKLHSCNICGKQLSSKHGLQYHLRIHEGIRPFPCPQCEKRYAQKSALSAHLKTHAAAQYPPGLETRTLNTPSRSLVKEEAVEEFGFVEEIVKDEEEYFGGIDEIQEEIEI